MTSSIAAPIYEIEKHCNIEIAAQISHISAAQNGMFPFADTHLSCSDLN